MFKGTEASDQASCNTVSITGKLNYIVESQKNTDRQGRRYNMVAQVKSHSSSSTKRCSYYTCITVSDHLRAGYEVESSNTLSLSNAALTLNLCHSLLHFPPSNQFYCFFSLLISSYDFFDQISKAD